MCPQFFLLAGPNGAGKSTYGRDYISQNTFFFNGDEIYASFLRRYPTYDPDKLKGSVPSTLEKERDFAISQKKDFAFESNYSDDMAVEITKLFKKEGYQVNLIYFGLDSIEMAAIRVDNRVALGGHNISSKEIEYNYWEGIKKVNENLHLYDTVRFVDTENKGMSKCIAYYLNDSINFQLVFDNVKWFKTNFENNIRKHIEKRRRESISNEDINTVPIKRFKRKR